MKKTAAEIIEKVPNAFKRRHEIILALCRGINIGAFGSSALETGWPGVCIAKAADRILEATEQESQ